ncbi:unnamed protein product [Alopecurus aequalis]
MSAALAPDCLLARPAPPPQTTIEPDYRSRRTDRPPLPGSMANGPGAPHVFVDNRETLQGPQITLLLYSTEAAARRHQDWLDIDSSEHEQQGHPPSHLPNEVDVTPPIGLVNRYLGLEDDEVENSRPRSPTTTWDIPSGLPLVADGATKVVRLAGMLSPDDLRDDEFYQEVLEDFIVEACKFGNLVEAVIPRPGDPAVLGGVGKVFLKYARLDDSIRCRTVLDGRWFAGRRVAPEYFPEDRFAAGDYGYNG